MEDLAVFAIVGIGLIGVGLYLMFGKMGRDKPGQIAVEATVVYQSTRSDVCDSDHPNQASTVSTYPVYEYTVNGKTYRTEGKVAITVFSKNKYQVGAKEMVRLDPSRPEKIHTDAERKTWATFGAALVVFGLVALYMVMSETVFY